MEVIEAEIFDIAAVCADAFTSLTKKVAAIDLKETGLETIEPQGKYAFMIHTTGVFQSAIRCDMESALAGQIARNLNKGEELPEDVRILYLTEYLNIVCGRALSSINNELKSASRLTVPKYMAGEGEASQEAYDEEKWIYFSTEYGNMQISLKYNCETQRRQNNMAKTVLVIDDSPFIANQVKDGIDGNNYNVVGHARSGEEGITMCEELAPDVVLLDIIMPGIDGFETARQIQQKMPKTKIIMLSSLCDNETLEEVKNIGLKYLIPKPLEVDVLTATLELAFR